MKISSLTIVLLILALTGCAANKSSNLAASQRAEIAQIDAALKLVGEQHFAEAEGVIQPVIHAKDFARLPSAEQYRGLLTAAKLAFTLKHPKLEYESRVRLLALPEATAEDPGVESERGEQAGIEYSRICRAGRDSAAS